MWNILENPLLRIRGLRQHTFEKMLNSLSWRILALAQWRTASKAKHIFKMALCRLCVLANFLLLFGKLERSGEKNFMPEELSRNQSILFFDVILQQDWPIEQCLLYIRVFLSGKTKSPRVDLFIHWLRQQITNTCRKHFSRSYKNRSMLFKETCMNLEKPLTAYVNLLSCFLEWFYLTR